MSLRAFSKSLLLISYEDILHLINLSFIIFNVIFKGFSMFINFKIFKILSLGYVILKTFKSRIKSI